MRMLTMIGALLCSIGCFPEPCVAQTEPDHAYVVVAASKNMLVLVDRKTLARYGNSVTAWTVWVNYPSQKTTWGLAAYSIDQSTYDCSARTYATKTSVLYSIDGNVLRSQPIYYPTAEVVIPDTVGEGALKEICGDWVTTADTSMTDVSSAVQNARSYMADLQKNRKK